MNIMYTKATYNWQFDLFPLRLSIFDSKSNFSIKTRFFDEKFDRKVKMKSSEGEPLHIYNRQ